MLDAVFSIGAHYSATTRTCWRYAAHAELATPLVDSVAASTVIGTASEQPLNTFVHDFAACTPEAFAASVLRNRQRTTRAAASAKAEAALRYAETLGEAGVHRFADVSQLVAEEARHDALWRQLRLVPGNGASDVRLGYLWMLIGDDWAVKPDRMVLGWLGRVLNQPCTTESARRLLANASKQLGHTPRELDHAIWNAQRTDHPMRV